MLYRIRPLRWENNSSFTEARAYTVIGTLRVNCYSRNPLSFCWWPDDGATRDCDSIEDGKARAEAYYQGRLAEALEAVTGVAAATVT